MYEYDYVFYYPDACLYEIKQIATIYGSYQNPEIGLVWL